MASISDTRSASIVLVIGAAGVAYWFYHLTSGRLSKGGPNQQEASGTPAGAGQPPTGDTLDRLEAFAEKWGLRVTSGYRPASSGLPGASRSLHAERRAEDVVGTITDQVRRAAAALGIHILEEQYRGYGPHGYSTNPHYHLSFPEVRGGREVF